MKLLRCVWVSFLKYVVVLNLHVVIFGCVSGWGARLILNVNLK